MALTGLEIYKHLPKTNCKDCGFPTCLAFAMKVAVKQVALDKCPHVTPAATAAWSPHRARRSNWWSSGPATARSRSATKRNSIATKRNSTAPPWSP